MSYGKETVFVTGTAKIGKSDPISSTHDIFFVGLIIDRSTHRIVDFTCNMVRDMTNDFLKSVILDYDIVNEEEALMMAIKDRFHGLAQKSVCASIKDGRNKYLLLSKK